MQCRKDSFLLIFKDIYSLMSFKQIIYSDKFLQSFAGSSDYWVTIISELYKCINYQQINLVLKSIGKCEQLSKWRILICVSCLKSSDL